MSDLLPPNATDGERDIAGAIERAAAVPVPIRDVWNPDTCPREVLPWLAWAFSVDDWDPTWMDAQKRAVIKSSVTVHRYKGTVGALREALGGLFFSMVVQEWYNQTPSGTPYTFRVLLESHTIGIEQIAFADMFTLIERTKNLRSHLDFVKVTVKADAGPTVGACAMVGSEIAVRYQGPFFAINETTIVI